MQNSAVLEGLISSIRKRDGPEKVELIKKESRRAVREAIDRELICEIISKERFLRRFCLLFLFHELILYYHFFRIRKHKS